MAKLWFSIRPKVVFHSLSRQRCRKTSSSSRIAVFGCIVAAEIFLESESGGWFSCYYFSFSPFFLPFFLSLAMATITKHFFFATYVVKKEIPGQKSGMRSNFLQQKHKTNDLIPTWHKIRFRIEGNQPWQNNTWPQGGCTVGSTGKERLINKDALVWPYPDLVNKCGGQLPVINQQFKKNKAF